MLCCETVFSGSVIAIMGAEKNDGKFTVEDFCMADIPLQTPRQPLSSDRYRNTPDMTGDSEITRFVF